MRAGTAQNTNQRKRSSGKVRHVRMLGLCLVAVFAVSAVFAASALAKKDPYTLNTWGQYKDCPYEYLTEIEAKQDFCIYGRTNGGKEGGEFKYGEVSVLLNKPIVIQVAISGKVSELKTWPATDGKSLESGPEKIVKGIGTITSRDMEQAEWPESLIEAFKAAKHNGEGKAYVTIEMASNKCFEVVACVNATNLLNEEGYAFHLYLKVTVHNAFLESLSESPCTIGSDEYPIEQNLTDEAPGYLASLELSESFAQIEAKTMLVDLNWHINPESGASGCGGPEYEGYIDAALNAALHVGEAERTGITWLTGDLHEANIKKLLTEGFESGELP
jgi:hypothetical protein